MPMTEPKIPADKLPAYNEALCEQVARAVGQMLRAREMGRRRADAEQTFIRRECELAKVGAVNACIALVVEAYALAAQKIGEPIMNVEFTWSES